VGSNPTLSAIRASVPAPTYFGALLNTFGLSFQEFSVSNQLACPGPYPFWRRADHFNACLLNLTGSFKGALFMDNQECSGAREGPRHEE
jgi:hypothetical protein